MVDMLATDLPLNQRDFYDPNELEQPSGWQAMLERENSIGSLLAYTENMPDDLGVDPEFNAFDESNTLLALPESERLELLSSRNKDEFYWKHGNIQREKRNLAVIHEMSLTNSLSLGLAAAVVDHIAWAMAPLPAIRGASFGIRALKAAPIGMADMAFTEVALHSTQTERGLDESLFNVGGGALFAGVLGGWLGRSDVAMDVAKIQDDAIKADGSGTYYTDTYEAPIPEGAVVNPDRSAGAAEVRTYNKLVSDMPGGRELQDDMYNQLYKNEITPEEFTSKIATIASDQQQVVGGAAIKFVKKLTPALHASFSKNWRMVSLGDKLMESSLLKKFHVNGKSGSHAMDTMIEARVGMEVVTRLAVGKKHYGDMVGSHSSFKQGLNDAKALMGSGSHMSLEEFNTQITRAFDNKGVHDNEFVAAAAKELREMDVRFEEMLVENKVLMPGNFERGRELDKSAATNDAKYRDLETKRDRIVDDMEKGRIEIEEAQARLDVAGDNPEVVKKLTQQLSDTEKRVKTRVQKKANRLTLNQKNMKESLHKRNELMKELDEFRYDPTHGDPMGGGWYTPRVFKTDLVFMNKDAFINRTTADLTEQMREATMDTSLSPEDLQKAIDDYVRATDTQEGRDALKASMEDTWKRITKNHTGYDDVQLGGASRFKAQRKLTVRNEALRGKNGEVDFLESDYFAIKRAHVRAMSPELTMKEQGLDFVEEMRLIDDEYNRLVGDAGEGSKAGIALRREQTELTTKMTKVYELLNNRLGHPDNPFGPANRMRSVIMNWNVMRALGSMTISALPDLGNIIAKIGLGPVSRQLTSIATHPSKFKMGITAARRLSLVTERVMASRMNQIALTGNMAPGVGAAEKGMHKAANYFITATGMNHWNQGLKEFVITAYSDEVMRTAKRLVVNPDSMSKINKAKFARAGIDSDDWAKIAEQHAIHGENAGGLEIPNIDLWEDDIQYKLMMVLKKEADTAVVTPGAGDLPLWMRSHVGGMMGQFKSFSFAATNKIMLPSMQRMAMGDPSAFAGMSLQLALGSAVYGLKMHMQGREVDTEWNTLVRESIDRSGYFGIFADANAMLEKVSRGKLGVQGVYGAFGIESPELSRYYTRPILGDIMGPSVGTIEDMNKVIGSVFKGDITEGDISAWRRMIPYQNLHVLRYGFNVAQDNANESLVQ